MKLKEYIRELNKLVIEYPEAYELPVIYSKDDEGNAYHNVIYSKVIGWWKDTGKPQDLLSANKLLLDEMKLEDFNAPDKVFLGEKVVLKNKVKIIGPAIVGDSSVLENCTIGPYTVLGKNNFVKDLDIEDSIVFDGCSLTRKGIKIKSSIIGNNVELAEDNEKDNCHHMLLGDNSFVEF